MSERPRPPVDSRWKAPAEAYRRPVAEGWTVRRWLVLLATALFGIVPMTLEFLAELPRYLRVANRPPGVETALDAGQIAVVVVLVPAGMAVGYVALFYAARSRVTGPVVVALLLGVAAMACAKGVGIATEVITLPMFVSIVHVVAVYYLRFRMTQ